jgi:hypothetical protein
MSFYAVYPPPGGSVLPAGSATAANQVLEIAQLTAINSNTTGSATAAKQDTGNASLASIDGKLTAPLSVTGPLTDTQLRASPVDVSAASLPLPSGAATAANQATEIASLASIDTKLTSPLAVTGPLTDAELRASAVPVSMASAPLPTGAATAANQATEIASLASIDSKLTSPLTVTGPLTDAQLRATPVDIASRSIDFNGNPNPDSSIQIGGVNGGGNLTPMLVSFSGEPNVIVNATVLAVGAATDANQATEIASLASIDGKIVHVDTDDVTISQPLPAGTNAIGTVGITPASSAAVTSVSASASSVTLLAANPARRMATIFNASTDTLYVKLGSTASTADFTVVLVPNAYYELPQPVYQGDIDGIWSGTNGAALVTEIV